jgi:hypothetical protein
MINDFLTPADFLTRGLGLVPLPTPPQPVPPGTCCAITGQPITEGYPVRDMVTDATNEFLDCFRGGVHGYVSDAAARCFKNSDPRKGNPTARAAMIFEDGTYHNPLISRDSAGKSDGRPCWSDLVRAVWPERAGQRVLIILTTDMKRRLWIRARVGTLGPRTPIFYYDSETAGNEVLLVDWPRLIECLDLVETIYTAGFVKPSIRESLWRQSKAIEEVGYQQTRMYEAALREWRGTPEFQVATLITQKLQEE